MNTILLLTITSIVVCFIVILIENYLLSYTNKIYKDVVNKDLCNTIINKSNEYTYETYKEPVDSKKVYQIDVYSSIEDNNPIQNKVLWKYVKDIYQNSISPILKKTCLKYKLLTKLKIDWVFIRKYNTFEREDLSIHTDENIITVNVLLSDTSKYSGGEFYIFDRKTSQKYMNYYDNVLQENETKKKEFIQSFETLPIVDMNQGDIIIYSGMKHLHGVLPMNSGTRYIISYFLSSNIFSY